jgi:hypothetical protein
MITFRGLFGVLLAASLLAACGGKSTPTATIAASTARGTLVASPPLRTASLDAAGFLAQLGASTSGKQLLQLTGNPTCGVDFYYIKFWTVGGANEPTESSGALMVPTGGAAGCSGPRPIVEYAHGTTTDKAYNIANIADTSNPANSEAGLVAAMFAAQGYIVVAPNYAGYDISTLGYHPYVNALQQSNEMMDMLAAARAALPNTLSSATSDNGKLFLTGYSEGGYVAMATQRAMQAAKQTVTAAAPMSGPYALEAFGDALFFGAVDLGSTVFAPLVTTSYQHAYGNIYTATTDVYSTTYASGIDTLLPSTTTIDQVFTNGTLPQTALFNSTTPNVTIPNNPQLSATLTGALAVPHDPNNPETPLFDLGFGTPYLVNNSYRVSYALDAAQNPDGAVPTPAAGLPLAAAPPAQTLRLGFYTNDLRNGKWAPNSPTLMCGGVQDPTVFFPVNTLTMQAFWAALPPGLITVLDVNATPVANDPFAPIQVAFQAAGAAEFAFLTSAAGGGLSPAAAQKILVEKYHTSVLPFCALAARSFFGKF